MILRRRELRARAWGTLLTRTRSTSSGAGFPCTWLRRAVFPCADARRRRRVRAVCLPALHRLGLDHWLRIGASSIGRRPVVAGFAGIAVCMSACALADPRAVLAMADAAPALHRDSGLMLPQTLAGPDALPMVGVQFLGQFCRNSAPVIHGIVVDRTGNFSFAFLIAAVLARPA